MIGTSEQLIMWLYSQDDQQIFEIKKYREKRSLNANSYAWALISKIGDAMRMSKEDVYLQMLRDYGQSEMISVLSHIDLTGYFKYFEAVATTKLQGKDFTHYRIYKGSSEYDSKEMSILIDGIVQEAKNLRIETLPPYEIQRMVELWRANK